MSLDLTHLDACTRRYMLAELESDLARDMLYYSPHLNEEGQRIYYPLLRAAVTLGTETSFAEALRSADAVRPLGRWQHSKEIAASDALTATAALLAEREFHRFYIRGLCCRALDQGVSALVIYRARPATQGRPSSDAMVGVRITVSSLLEDLRVTFRGVPPHGLPQCHDPGLSVRLP